MPTVKPIDKMLKSELLKEASYLASRNNTLGDQLNGKAEKLHSAHYKAAQLTAEAEGYKSTIAALESSLTELHARHAMLQTASNELACKYTAIRERFFALFDLVVNNSDGIDWKSIIRNH